MVLALGHVPTMVLAGFNDPVATDESEQFGVRNFALRQGGDSVTEFISGLIYFSAPDLFDLGADAEHALHAGQTQASTIGSHAHQLAGFTSAVGWFIDRYLPRGEATPGGAFWLVRKRWVDCL